MTNTPAIKSVGIVGCGLIGMSWAAFLAKGLDVRATDPVGKAEDNLRVFVAEVWPQLESLGLAQGAAQDRLNFSTEIGQALDGVDFVQENGPERVELKRDIIRSVSEAVRNDVIIASSSSRLMPSTFQEAAVNPGRVPVGHPFNPPHLVPLVEIVGGKLTSETSVAQAIAFYKMLGKRPVRLRKEMKGHIANQLQAAILREVFPHELEPRVNPGRFRSSAGSRFSRTASCSKTISRPVIPKPRSRPSSSTTITGVTTKGSTA